MGVCSAGRKRFAQAFERKTRTAENIRLKNLLALRKTCDIFAPVSIPHFSEKENSRRASVGKAENPTRGASAAWASFFWSSSG
jgi:hypothetical protein